MGETPAGILPILRSEAVSPRSGLESGTGPVPAAAEPGSGLPEDSLGPPGIAAAAAALARSGMVLGLGTGRAAAAFVREIGKRMRRGLRIRGVPTSSATERLAAELGIPLVGFDQIAGVDLAVDGADEVDPERRLIKGHGGALVRERVVAAAAARFVVLVGPEKLSPRLGARQAVPVEVIPFAAPVVEREISRMGADAGLRRRADGEPFVTDNGNWLLHARFPEIPDPAALRTALGDLPGVLDSGLFVGLADEVLVEGRAPLTGNPSA